ncbi:hypothetical protein ACLI1C_01970 [Devosia sp. XGJD_8]|uniref:hypothetical protein n=1 Tax=Devosia sp. XGJD_8 TaxID=3391187 RepID=UPI0039855D10
MDNNENKVVLTDAAEEMANLWRTLFEITGQDNKPTYSVLATWCGVDTKSSDLARILGTVARRIGELKELVESSDHPLLAPTYREDLLTGLSKMALPLLPSTMNQEWRTNKAKIHPSEVSLVNSFGHIARAYRPLKVIGDSEREQLLEQSQAILEEIDASEEIAPWARHLVRSGLVDLIFTLRHLPQLGHGVAALEIETFYHKAAQVERRSNSEGEGVASKMGHSSILKAVNVAMFALNLVAVPPQAEEYAGWYASKLSSVFSTSIPASPTHRAPDSPLMLPKRPEDDRELME